MRRFCSKPSRRSSCSWRSAGRALRNFTRRQNCPYAGGRDCPRKEAVMNRLKRMTMFGMLGAIGALASARAFAHGYRGMHGAMDPAQMDEHIEHMVKHLAVEVDATPEQQQKLAAIGKEAARDLAPMREQAMQA